MEANGRESLINLDGVTKVFVTDEVETQLLLSTELGYVPESEMQKLTRKTAEVGRLLNGLYSAIQLRTENRELGTASR